MSAPAHDELIIVEAYWTQLRAVDERLLRRAVIRGRRRQLTRTLAFALLALLLAAAAAFAAKTLLFGSDAAPSFPSQVEALGAIEPGTSRVLAVRESDPAGGPPWGFRVFGTTRKNTYGSTVCVSAGRVVNGELVALGVAGAFGNDGKVHRLPTQAQACGSRGPGGQLLVAISVPQQPRSGLPALGISSNSGCLPPQERRALDRTPADARNEIREARASGDAVAEAKARRVLASALRQLRHPPATCPEADLRTLYFGFMGSNAVAVAVGGTEHSVDAREDGAFLFVLPDDGRFEDESITVRYKGGTVCPVGNLAHPRPTGQTRECVQARIGKP